jgi:cob(I)alamin adenosyltransferase
VAAERRRIDSTVATGRGDDGTTGLLYGGERIAKDDLRTEAYGTIDEAVAALGLARAELDLKRQHGSLPPVLGGIEETILRIQRDLFVVGAELATNPDAWDRLEDGRTRVGAAMVEGVETLLVNLEKHLTMPREFVVPGETVTSAALELARTILRRAERRAVALDRAGMIPGRHLLPYLNRLADFVWVLARAAEQAESRGSRPSRIAPNTHHRT